MARRRRTSTFEDLVELASRLPWWVALTLALFSYLLLHAYAIAPLPAITDPRQMGQHLTSSMFRGLASAGQYFFPLVFICGAIGSVFARSHRRKLLENVSAAIRPAQIIEGISWHDFELLIGEVFRRRGFTVLETGRAGPDGGVDLRLHRGAEKYIVQCKHWRSLKVGVGVVRELFGVMAAEGAVGGIVVTSGSFTADAKAFADGRNIELVDGVVLSSWVANGRVCIDRSAVVENPKPSCPYCGASMALRVAGRGKNIGEEFWGCSRYPRCRGTVNVAS